MFAIRFSDYRAVERPLGLSGTRAAFDTALSSRIPQKGDHFRDDFTRYCLYLASFAEIRSVDRIILAVGQGNRDSILAFEALCRRPDNTGPSAQHFAVATTSTAATTINIISGAKGGNITIDAGADGLFFALLAAGLFVTDQSDGVAHVFWEYRDPANGHDVIAYCSVSRDLRRLVAFELDFMAPHASEEIFALQDERRILEYMCDDDEDFGNLRLGPGWITSCPLHAGAL